MTPEGRRVVGEAQIVVDQLALEGLFANAAFAASDDGTVAYRTRSREIDRRIAMDLTIMAARPPILSEAEWMAIIPLECPL